MESFMEEVASGLTFVSLFMYFVFYVFMYFCIFVAAQAFL